MASPGSSPGRSTSIGSSIPVYSNLTNRVPRTGGPLFLARAGSKGGNAANENKAVSNMSHDSIVIAVHPMWCGKIADLVKDLEVRKRLPRLKPPFKVYIYCTRTSEVQFWKSPTGHYLGEKARSIKDRCGGGRVIGEFTCSNIFRYSTEKNDLDTISTKEITRRSCLSYPELYQYERGLSRSASQPKMSGLQAMEIRDLVLYDKPKLLQDYGLSTFPQSWCYAKKVPE